MLRFPKIKGKVLLAAERQRPSRQWNSSGTAAVKPAETVPFRSFKAVFCSQLLIAYLLQTADTTVSQDHTVNYTYEFIQVKYNASLCRGPGKVWGKKKTKKQKNFYVVMPVEKKLAIVFLTVLLFWFVFKTNTSYQFI